MVKIEQSDSPRPEDNPVDARTNKLMAEFLAHFRDVVQLQPDAEKRRDDVFHAWAMQKIAGLQIAVEEIATQFNRFVSKKP